MSAQKSLRKKFASVLATGTAALLAASGIALAPTAAFADEPAATPTITLSKSTLNPEGDLLTVTGSGFDASFKGLPTYYGCGPESANAPKGFYVQVGWIKDNWRPSTGGANNTDRRGPLNSWFADKNLNCQAPSLWTIAEDGTASFSYTFEVSQDALGALPADARYAVFTNGAGGTQAVNEVSQDFSFSNADPAPSVEASVTSAVRGKLDVKFDLANVSSPTGAYVSVIEKGSAGELSPTNLGVASDWIMPNQFNGTSATRTLSITADKLDRTKEYQIAVWRAHTLPTVGDVYAFGDAVEVTEAQWDEIFRPADETTTVVSFKSANYNAASTATVTVKAVGSSATPTGTVSTSVAGKTYKATLKNGKATIKLNKLAKVRSYKATASYTSSNQAAFKNSKSKSATFKVTKATPRVTAKLAKSKVKSSQRATVKVQVSVPGALKAKASKVKVQVFDGKKRIKSATTNSQGKVSVKLSKLKKGSHKIKVKVVGNSSLNAKTSSTKKLTVTK